MKRIKPIHKQKNSERKHVRFVPFSSKKKENEDSFSSSSEEGEDFSIPNHASLISQLTGPEPKQKEFATSLLMNISSDIKQKQLALLYTEETLQALLLVLQDNNVQVILNTLSAIQSLLFSEDNKKAKMQKKKQTKFLPFEKTNFLINQGLFNIFDKILLQSFESLQKKSLLLDEPTKNQLKNLLLKLLNTIGSFFEVLPEEIIEKTLKNTIFLVFEIFISIENEEIFVETLNLLHIMSEFTSFTLPKDLIFEYYPRDSDKGVVFNKMKDVFVKPLNAVGQEPNFELFLAKSCLLCIFLNIFDYKPKFTDPGFVVHIINFLEIAFKTPFLKEFVAISKVLDNENGDKMAKIWLKVAKIMEFFFIFLNNLAEWEEDFEDIEDEDEEDIEMNIESDKEKNVLLTEEKLFKEILIKELFKSREQIFLSILTDNLLISKETIESFDLFIMNGKENMISVACSISYLAFSAFYKSFLNKDGIFPLENHAKPIFLTTFVAKIKEIIHFLPETERFAGFEDIFLLFFQGFVEFLSENKGIFVENGGLTSLFTIEECVLLCEKGMALQNEEFFSLFSEFLSLRLPITVTSQPTFLIKHEELVRIFGLILKGMSDQRLQIQASTLNIIFDIFADETYNDFLKENGLLQTLETKDYSAFYAQKNKFFKETMQNVKEFVKYKRKLGV